MPDRVSTFYDEIANATLRLISGRGTLLFSTEASNVDNDTYFLQLFNAAAIADVTLGTTTPNHSLLIPAGDGTLHGAMDKHWNPPLDFPLGLVYAITTTAGGNTGPTTAMVLNIGFL